MGSCLSNLRRRWEEYLWSEIYIRVIQFLRFWLFDWVDVSRVDFVRESSIELSFVMQYLEVREKQYDSKVYLDFFTVSHSYLSTCMIFDHGCINYYAWMVSGCWFPHSVCLWSDSVSSSSFSDLSWSILFGICFPSMGMMIYHDLSDRWSFSHTFSSLGYFPLMGFTTNGYKSWSILSMELRAYGFCY